MAERFPHSIELFDALLTHALGLRLQPCRLSLRLFGLLAGEFGILAGQLALELGLTPGGRKRAGLLGRFFARDWARAPSRRNSLGLLARFFQPAGQGVGTPARFPATETPG